MNFEFSTAGRIIFGNGTLAQAAPAAAGFGRRALVVIGRDSERAQSLLKALHKEGVGTELFTFSGEPTVAAACAAAEKARTAKCDLVIGFGGGSVIDLAKAAAALMTNPGDPLDYLEVIGKGLPLNNRPAPCIAIPTTAGTGAEVTKNAVLASPEHKVKVSMRHPLMIPDLAIVDPECTLSMPPAVTAATGLDALTQLLEAFISKKANPMTDGFCREGLPRAVRSLRRAFENGADLKVREEMALASLFGGLALANAGLGAVHGFAGPLGGMFDAPHGMVCAALLPHVMKTNLTALLDRVSENIVGQASLYPESLCSLAEEGDTRSRIREACPARKEDEYIHYRAIERLTEFAQLTGGSSAEDGIRWLTGLCRDLQVPPLSALGVAEKDFPVIVEKSKSASSMKGNPVELTELELTRILHHAL
ncbi:MAG: iron-containing alcohol dehydrogenase [Kiritimatiellales bacterium]|jgi:alcohol dehydrogenase class IV